MNDNNKLVIIDSGVKDGEELIKNLPEGTQVAILNWQTDGIVQIVEILSDYKNQKASDCV